MGGKIIFSWLIVAVEVVSTEILAVNIFSLDVKVSYKTDVVRFIISWTVLF